MSGSVLLKVNIDLILTFSQTSYCHLIDKIMQVITDEKSLNHYKKDREIQEGQELF